MASWNDRLTNLRRSGWALGLPAIIFGGIYTGTFTPTEMLTAHRAGAPIVKFFPGPTGGPGAVRAIRGPLPFLRIFPTSGVTLENAADYLGAGAFGLGFVACLFEPDDLQAGRFEAVRDRAAHRMSSAPS